MKTHKIEKIVVTEYISDFGDVFNDERSCKESEITKYKLMLEKALKSEYAPIVRRLIEEIGIHCESAYCSIGICDDILGNIL